MGRKVFISFLGNGFYEPTRYVENEDDEVSSSSLRFIQEATINKFCKNYTKADLIYVFTTIGALANWNDGEHKNYKSNAIEWYEGLHTRLKELDLACSFVNVMIPDGRSTDEIWEIFRIVYEKLESNDELIFDITHGFRSLPMLNMVLINYAKLLKDILVKGIYYGAFEAKYQRNSYWYSPIWNLKDFEELQEWSNNAAIFLQTGNAISVTNQMTDEVFTDLKEKLSNFSKYILVNRGLDIYHGNTMVELNQELSKGILDFPKKYEPLKPILKKIEKEFVDYQEDSALNGFLAVRWCIRNGLIQQAATLLEEFIITFVMTEIGEYDSIANHEKRASVGAALAIGKDKPFSYYKPPLENDIIESEKILSIQKFIEWQNKVIPIVKSLSYQKDILKILNNLKNPIRNDINHAGFREKVRDFDTLESSIKKRYNETRKIIKQVKHIDFPEL